MLDLPGVAGSAPGALRGPTCPPLFGPTDVLAFRAATLTVRVAPAIKGYVVDLVRATRDPAAFELSLAPLITLGATPPATISLVRTAQAHALLAGRDYVTPHDVKSLARDVLRHRVIVSFEADAEGLTADDLIQRVLDHIPVP